MYDAASGRRTRSRSAARPSTSSRMQPIPRPDARVLRRRRCSSLVRAERPTTGRITASARATTWTTAECGRARLPGATPPRNPSGRGSSPPSPPPLAPVFSMFIDGFGATGRLALSAAECGAARGPLFPQGWFPDKYGATGLNPSGGSSPTEQRLPYGCQWYVDQRILRTIASCSTTRSPGWHPLMQRCGRRPQGMNMDKAACRARCKATASCTAIRFSDDGCQMSTSGCTLVAHNYPAVTDEMWPPDTFSNVKDVPSEITPHSGRRPELRPASSPSGRRVPEQPKHRQLLSVSSGLCEGDRCAQEH